MRKSLNRIIIALLTITLTLGNGMCPKSPEVAYAAEPEVSFYDDSKLSDVSDIKFQYLDTMEAAFEWSFPYTDDFFRHPSDEMSVKHAQGSLGMALCAFRSTAGIVDPQYETYLKGAGFINIYPFGYDKETTQDSLSGVIGMKEIDDFTVIACVTCGQGYQNEWAGNLVIGTGERHEGFDKAADLLESYLDEYIEKNNITEKKKLWLSGMSRAAAVANITAADAISSDEYDDVYAYLYGVPRTTRKPESLPGIYNISGQYDPVASIPLESWGFGRYGKDLYTPAQESENDYYGLSQLASKVSEDMTGKTFRNNPEINYQIRLILEFLGKFFPTSDAYVERFQEHIIKAMQDKGTEDYLQVLADAINETPANNQAEQESKIIFVDYLSYMVGEHIKANQRQVEEGSWIEDESLAANIVLEHRPSTYVNWMFSNADPEDLFVGPISTRKITIIGSVTADVYYKGELAGTVKSNGKKETFAVASDDGNTVLPEIFMMRNGTQTVINLPSDEEYIIELKSTKPDNLMYYDAILSADSLMETPGYLYAGRMNRGECQLVVTPGKRLGELIDESSRFTLLTREKYDFSPTTIMNNELGATTGSAMTIGRLVGLAFVVISGLNALLLIYLIIAFVHWRKRRKGHPPYSHWWVIVPHLICIAVFSYLTQFFTYHMFSVGQARAVCATAAILFVFILSLRGFIANRRRSNLIYMLLMLLLVPLAFFYYNRLPIDSFSYVNITTYVVIMIGLSVLAVRGFFVENVQNAKK